MIIVAKGRLLMFLLVFLFGSWTECFYYILDQSKWTFCQITGSPSVPLQLRKKEGAPPGIRLSVKNTKTNGHLFVLQAADWSRVWQVPTTAAQCAGPKLWRLWSSECNVHGRPGLRCAQVMLYTNALQGAHSELGSAWSRRQPRL